MTVLSLMVNFLSKKGRVDPRTTKKQTPPAIEWISDRAKIEGLVQQKISVRMTRLLITWDKRGPTKR